MEDRDIIRLFFDRSEDAISGCQEKYGRYCKTIAFNILGNMSDAEECVSDCLFRAWNAIPPESPDSLKSYLGRICRNLALDIYEKLHAQKRGGGQMEACLDELSEVVADPSSELEGLELSEILDSFLAGLEKEKRIIFVKRYWYAEPVRTIAEELGISESKVKTSLSRTREQLKKHLVQEGIRV